MFRRKAPPIPPLPERPPDVIVAGRPMWLVKANPDGLARRRDDAARQRAIDAARRRESQPAPYGAMWMDV